MAQTITPVVHGGRRGRWARSVAAHVVGATASAAALGAALGAAGRVLGGPWGRAGLAASRVPRMVNGIALTVVAGVAIAAAARSKPEWGTGAPAVVVGAAFAWAATAKILRPRAWRGALNGYGLGGLERAASVGVPILELTVPALVVAGQPRAAAALTLVLLGSFSMALLRARRLGGDRVPCGCFGRSR